jgi:hypothetical protein
MVSPFSFIVLISFFWKRWFFFICCMNCLADLFVYWQKCLVKLSTCTVLCFLIAECLVCLLFYCLKIHKMPFDLYSFSCDKFCFFLLLETEKQYRSREKFSAFNIFASHFLRYYLVIFFFFEKKNTYALLFVLIWMVTDCRCSGHSSDPSWKWDSF